MANEQQVKNELTARRRGRIRAKVNGTATRPRLSVHRSLRHITAQLIDDTVGKTIAAAQDIEVKVGKDVKSNPGVAAAFLVGKLLGERAIKLGVSAAVFDRAGRRYHGQVKALADGAREAGLKF